MKQSVILTITSLLSILFRHLHLAHDITRGLWSLCQDQPQ